MTGLMSSISAGGIGTLNAPIVLSNFNLRGARFPLLLGASTLSNDGTTQPPIAILDVGLSFTKPNWLYNIAVRNQSGTTAYSVLADVRYQLTSYSSPGFYGGSYDDASTLTYTWTEQTAAPALDYYRIDIDDTGTNAVCVMSSGGPYISNDGGVTWGQRVSGMNTPAQTAQVCLARSAPTRMYAAVAGDSGGSVTYLYASTDGGGSWTPIVDAGFLVWSRIKCNYNGTVVLASEGNGNLYLSTDSGTTWTTQTTGGGSNRWGGVYVSDDGQTLVGVVSNGYIWVSTDGGTSWAQTATFRDWVSVAGSSDGCTLCALANGGGSYNIYLSTDSGTTWTQTSALTGNLMYQVAMSINGNKIAVTGAFGGIVYVTQDGGTTWGTPPGTPSGSRYAIAMTPDGTKLIVGGNATDPEYPYTAVGV
jgi:photosystem II stability/assembly factor-like uncharacterized protein